MMRYSKIRYDKIGSISIKMINKAQPVLARLGKIRYVMIGYGKFP